MRQYDGKDIGRIGGEFGRMLKHAEAITVRAKSKKALHNAQVERRVDNFLKSIGYVAK